jgi:hypothetical protein
MTATSADIHRSERAARQTAWNGKARDQILLRFEEKVSSCSMRDDAFVTRASARLRGRDGGETKCHHRQRERGAFKPRGIERAFCEKIIRPFLQINYLSAPDAAIYILRDG